MLFLFAFLIKDLRNQLQNEHDQFIRIQQNKNASLIHIYRGQLMTAKELKQLQEKNSITWLVNNTFLSTTFDQTLRPPDHPVQSVLFEIEVNTDIPSRPYEKVIHLTQFKDEEECLFTFGTQFVKREVFYDSMAQIYIARLQVSSDYRSMNYQPSPSDNERKRLKKAFRLLEIVATDLSEEDLDTIFNELTTLYPDENQWILAVKTFWLAEKYQHDHAYMKALSSYQAILPIWHKFLDDEDLNCLFDIAHIHHNVALCYHHDLKDHSSAEKEYLQAIEYYKFALKSSLTPFERIRIYGKLCHLENHRLTLNGYDPNESEMVVRYNEQNLAILPNKQCRICTNITTSG